MDKDRLSFSSERESPGCRDCLVRDNQRLREALDRQKQTEEQLRQQISALETLVLERDRKLENANRELRSFSYSIAHDMRAPLRSINSFCEVLREECADKLDETVGSYLARICASSGRMTQLVEAALMMARVSAREIKSVKVDLSQLAFDIISNRQEKDPERQVEVVIRPGLIAYGDRFMLQLALEQLFDNAWKYTQTVSVPRIEFGMENRDDEGPLFFVRDNGIGFDMKYVNKVFAPFHRLHGVNEYDGTGIGLAVVHRIISRHGGKIEARGEAGRGSTFFFSLPKKTPVGFLNLDRKRSSCTSEKLPIVQDRVAEIVG